MAIETWGRQECLPFGSEVAAAGQEAPPTGAGEAGTGLSDLYEPTNNKDEPVRSAGAGLAEGIGGRIASNTGETEPAPLAGRDEREAP